MGTDKKLKVKNALFITALVALVCGLVILFLYKFKITSGKLLLNDGWTVSLENQTYSGYELSSLFFDATNMEDDVTLTATLPDTDFNSPVLAFLSCHSVVSMYIDGDLVYSYGQDRHEKNKLVGYGYHFVELGTLDYAGKELEIDLHVTENRAFTSIGTPYIVNEDNIIQSVVEDDPLSFVAGLFLVAFGFIFLVVTMLTGSYALDGRQTVALAIFAISLGLWTLCSHHMQQFFTPNLWDVTTLEFFTLYTAPLALLLYFRKSIFELEGHEKLKITYKVICLMDMIFFVAFNVCEIMNLVHYPALQDINLVMIVAVAAVGIFVIVTHFKDKSNILLVVGVAVFMLTAAFDMGKFYVQKYISILGKSDFSGVSSLGCVVFLSFLLASFYMRLNEEAENRGRRALLELQANTDALTGLANRRKCKDTMEQLDAGTDEYGIISFDLNNLKYVNDKMGHIEGDTLICSFAKCLTQTFDGDNFLVGRTGGDEFMVFVKKPGSFNARKYEDMLEKNMMATNEMIAPLCISTAYGYATSNEVGSSAQDVIKLSDYRMYENKKDVKAAREKKPEIIMLKSCQSH